MGTGPVNHLAGTNPNQGLNGWNTPIPGVCEELKFKPESTDRTFGVRHRCAATTNCAQTFKTEVERDAHVIACPEVRREREEAIERKRDDDARIRADEAQTRQEDLLLSLVTILAENNRQLVAAIKGGNGETAPAGLGDAGAAQDRPAPVRRGRPPSAVPRNSEA